MDAEQPDMSITAPNSFGLNGYMTPFTPQTLGRPSSPLNPHAGSSSPLTSPTPLQQSQLGGHFAMQQVLYPDSSASAGPSRPFRGRNLSLPSVSGSGNARFARRPTAPAHSRSSLPSGTTAGLAYPLDLFTEGTSPVQGQLWRDRLGRRMEERERRKRSREEEMGRRRGLPAEEIDQEAADRRAQEDDEEVSHLTASAKGIC
jgi:hypothetical protein